MFGAGPRACVGRKFAHTEAVFLLALLLRDWQLDIDLELGETRSAYEDRVMGTGGFEGTVFSVGTVAVKMKKRRRSN
jgi:cytochrome P450